QEAWQRPGRGLDTALVDRDERREPTALGRGLVAVERFELLAQLGDLGFPGVEEEEQVRTRAGAEANAAAARARQRHRVLWAVEQRLGERHGAVQPGATRKQRRDAPRELVAELIHARVRHRGLEEAGLPAVRADQIRRRRVVDGAVHD